MTMDHIPDTTRTVRAPSGRRILARDDAGSHGGPSTVHGSGPRGSPNLALAGGPDGLLVRREGGRLRLDLHQLGTLARIARTARAVGGLRSLLARLPAREVELALRGSVVARRVRGGGASGGWRLHPLGLLKALGARA